uniref:Exo-alpha-(1->6)-L-arabinopyranosidase n=1 Tax=Pseudonocardia sp. Gsoil1536 TaxID=1271883 RepID=L0EKB3_9PSEU|nr:glycoside hydrolase [Pseudonocardia sp. Gsoil1536]
MIDPVDLTLAEKASLASGGSFWSSKAVRDIPPVYFTDGPHGVRKQGEVTDHLGVAMSTPSTCFPPAAGLSQSWNPELVQRIGKALAQEARAQGVDVLLGPGVNIKRHPLGGRNFEYLSEDPILSSELGIAWVRGLQGEGIGASVKHFAANNQETDRHRISADIDPRALREIYLRSFQRVIQQAKPWTVMCAYNALNGVPVSENSFLLTQVLRDEWKYNGLVISDWGAVTDRVASARAGVDLEMPPSEGSDQLLLDAAHEGAIDIAIVDRIAERAIALATKTRHGRTTAPAADLKENHALAREAARQSIVLLKNDGALLPLTPGVAVAVIGHGAVAPRFQGAGSSFVNPTEVDIPFEELVGIGGPAVRFTQGHSVNGAGDDEALRDEAVAAARAADVAVVFLTADIESEGRDREDLDIPADQMALALAVHEANPRTIIVLARGGVVRLGELQACPAVLDGALLGQGIGRALAEVIYGIANPSGKLSETIPIRIEDAPAFGNFPGENGHVRYGEGLLVGYRGYDARKQEVSFPFGHGLSYTTFQYTDLEVQCVDGGLEARVTITNTGPRAGREVAQFYTSLQQSAVDRPLRELKGFASIELEPGQSGEVTAFIAQADLAYWDIRVNEWIVEGGTYEVSVGASSRDIRGTTFVDIIGDEVTVELNLHSTVGEFLANPVTAPILLEALSALVGPGEQTAVGGDVLTMISAAPLQSMLTLLGDNFDRAALDALLEAANVRTPQHVGQN